MTSGGSPVRWMGALGLVLWALLILLPLLALAVGALSPVAEADVVRPVFSSLLRTVVLSGIIAAVAVVLGWLPGRLLGTCGSHRAALLMLLLLPLVLPQYVLYYAWSLLLSPTTQLGRALASSPALARSVGTAVSTGVLIGWYWPLAALILAQGRRSIDYRIWQNASLDASRFQVFRHVTLPLLRRTILLAFGVCFVLSLSEFAAFHLAGVQTVGTELAVLYELTGAAAPVARAAWPIVLVALIVAVFLARASDEWASSTPAFGPRQKPHVLDATALGLLLLVSWAAPVALLVTSVTTLQPLRQFITLHLDDLLWSVLIAGCAAAFAYLIALGGLFATADRTRRPLARMTSRWCVIRTLHSLTGIPGGGERLVGWAVPTISRICSCGLVGTAHPTKSDRLWPRKAKPPQAPRDCLHRRRGLFIHGSIFLAMFLPASVLAVSMLKLAGRLPVDLRQSWLMVSGGQGARFAGLALILLLLTRYPDRRRLDAMASLDGASPLKAWWHIHFPRTWPVLVGTFLLVMMLSFTELPATMVLLPAGLPNFAQRLLNQMHYARDQQVIASCLVLVSLFVVLTGVTVLLLRIGRMRSLMGISLSLLLTLALGGCGGDGRDGEPRVVTAFGSTGAGPGEFLYPRAIDLGGDGSVLVADKTGRIQRLDLEGQCLGVIRMPLVETGKPTGMTLHEDGRLFVADTHYHRVAIFSLDGKLVGEFGKYGQESGCFIYPTDIAFSPDGRIFVSEYGGNDRVSIFTSDGEFLSSFGSPGDGAGQFSRPAALCIDEARGRLYVADACNHRIGVYDLGGRLTGYIGTVGQDPGRLRYPYGLALLADGTLVVCEYGNNRIQLFDPQGRSVAVYGQAGRELGRLAYPWAVAVDARRRAYIVDAGNNRIQVWQL